MMHICGTITQVVKKKVLFSASFTYVSMIMLVNAASKRDSFTPIVSHTHAIRRLLLSSSLLTSSIWFCDIVARGIIISDAYFGVAYLGDAADSMFVFVYEVRVRYVSINNITIQIVVNSTTDFITCLCN